MCHFLWKVTFAVARGRIEKAGNGRVVSLLDRVGSSQGGRSRPYAIPKLIVSRVCIDYVTKVRSEWEDVDGKWSKKSF